MKTKYKIALIIIILYVLFNFDYINVKAYILNSSDKELEIYKIKIEELLVNNNIFKFYEDNLDKMDTKEKIIEIPKEEDNLDLKNEIVEFSKKFIGNSYKRGGTSLQNGADCSGFVQSIFSNFDIKIPRTSYMQSQFGEEISIENIEIASIVSYGYNGKVSHSALYIGDDKIIHSSNELLGIRIDNINIMPIITIRKII